MEESLRSKLLRRQGVKQGYSGHSWLISSDKIFSSDIKGFGNFFPISWVEFEISRKFLFDGTVSADLGILASPIKVHLLPGKHCPSLLELFSKRSKLPKILIGKTATLNGEIAMLDSYEYSGCSLQGFSVRVGYCWFEFHCESFQASYTDYEPDGIKSGTASIKVYLGEWKMENS
ncbi:MAG: hypothetical protein LBS14_00790 [Holosporaceae bacterium]|nr:hypothetical protein [Holosporaceae bacterium]